MDLKFKKVINGKEQDLISIQIDEDFKNDFQKFIIPYKQGIHGINVYLFIPELDLEVLLGNLTPKQTSFQRGKLTIKTSWWIGEVDNDMILEPARAIYVDIFF